jgi:hypothetical protein
VGKFRYHLLSSSRGIVFVCTHSILVHTSTYQYIPVHTDKELFVFSTVTPISRISRLRRILPTTRTVFMCILRFHHDARAGYLQTYETLIKEINDHPGSAPVADDQYLVESVAPSDRIFDLACETGIRYPSLVAMFNSRSMLWRATVIFHDMHVHTCIYQHKPVHTTICLVCTLIVL